MVCSRSDQSAEKSYPQKQQLSLVNLALLHRTKQQTWENETGMTFIRNGKLTSLFFKGRIKITKIKDFLSFVELQR